MAMRLIPGAAFLAAALPFAICSQQTPASEPKCEEVFKNIQSFKGVPAKDLIPSMQFMAASMNYRCEDCHDPKGYEVETGRIVTTRKMIDLQREINANFFNGRLEVTCNSCHMGREHPVAVPLPEGTTIGRKERIEGGPRPPEIFEKHRTTVGAEPAALTLKGTLTKPSEDHKTVETTPFDVTYAAGGRFRMNSAIGPIGFDGTMIWLGKDMLAMEPAAVFGRLGRSWRGEKAFDGLTRLAIAGADKLNGADMTVVRGTRTATDSQEEMYFDNKTGLLMRFVNLRPSNVGTVVTTYDYSGYKSVNGVMAPMKMTVTFSRTDQWVFKFDSATTAASVDESIFKLPGG